MLAALADEMDVHLGLPDAAAARRELTMLTQSPASDAGSRAGQRRPVAAAARSSQLGPCEHTAGPGRALLATWHNLLDAGRMQDGEPQSGRHGACRRRADVGRDRSRGSASADGGKVTVATGHGAITVPVEIADMPDRVVWLPTNSAGCARRGVQLGAGHGAVVVPVRSAE